MGDINPYGLCTWDEESDCINCELQGKLRCKLEKKHLLRFLLTVLPFAVSSAFGMIFSGVVTNSWILQILYIVFVVIFFTVLEIGVLCRHCPYYARSGLFIRCHANYGLPKTWDYNPKPMNTLEKTTFLISLTIFGGLPFYIELRSLDHLLSNPEVDLPFFKTGLIGFTITTLLSIILLLTVLRYYFCPFCINFSCPLNRVQYELVKSYLDKNSIMKNS